MVFDGEDFLVFEVVLQRGVVELIEDRVEFEGHHANEHIPYFLAEARPRITVYGKLELPGTCGAKLELGNEGMTSGASLKNVQSVKG